MQELVDRVAAAASIDSSLAEKSIGIILGFLKKEAPAAEMGQLMAAIPGAEAMVADGAGAGKGSLIGGAMSMMGDRKSVV